MNVYTKLILDAAEQITRAGGSAKCILGMPLCEAIETLEKNGVHVKLVQQTKTEIQKPKHGEWISNVGNSRSHHPETLSNDTKIEVTFRSGESGYGKADYWESSWKEVDDRSESIVAYRIIE